KAGRALSTKELDTMEEALEAAKEADADNDIAAGIKALSGVRRLGVMGGKECFARPVVEANRLVDEWAEKAKPILQSTAEQSSSGEATFEVALAYVRMARTFAELPGLEEELSVAARQVERNQKLSEVLRQAKAIDSAQVLAATRDGRKKASAAFSRI